MPVYELYDGKIKLDFDESKHRYTVEGKEVPSSTGILKVINKPALIYWALNVGGEYLESNLPVGKAIDEIEKVSLIDGMKREHRLVSKKASNIGTLVHDCIEKYIKKKIDGSYSDFDYPVNEAAVNSVLAFLEWEQQHDIKYLRSESKVYSIQHNYAGTDDIEAIIDGELGIIDLKTSSGIYPEYFLQLASYAMGRLEETGEEFTNNWIIRIGKDASLETEKQKSCRKDFEGFKGCLLIHNRLKDLNNR